MNKLQEWEQRRRDMGLVAGHARLPTPRLRAPGTHDEPASRADARSANKLEEWEQRRRDMGLVPGVPRRPSPSFAAPEHGRGTADAVVDQADPAPLLIPIASADDRGWLKFVRDAGREGGLRTPEEFNILHRYISGAGEEGYKNIVEIARQIKAGEIR